jgi:hypothetical protein
MVLVGCSNSHPQPHTSSRVESPSPSHAVVLTKEQTASVLFGAAQVPATWTVTGQATDGPGPDGMVANSRRAFTAPDLNGGVAIGATSYTSVTAAHARLLLWKQQSAGPLQSSASVTGADEALRHTCVNCGGTIEFRIGTIVARVSIEPDSGPAPHAELLSAIATVYAQRIEQVLAGQPPTVSLR